MKNNYLNEFADRLKGLRLEKGLSINELSLKTKISTASISRWEACLVEPKPSQLLILSDFFGVTVDYLLGKEN